MIDSLSIGFCLYPIHYLNIMTVFPLSKYFFYQILQALCTVLKNERQMVLSVTLYNGI